MFDLLFGWRKASKCKKLVRHLQCRLKIMKSKIYSIVRQSRDDIAQLLKNEQHEMAFARVEQLFKDQDLLAAYDLLHHFCEFIIINFCHIRRHKNCPNDIKEAISTLIFAAAWCGDLPELQKIRKLFGERYGRKFTKSAVELYPGNLVNHQIREKLGIKSIPDDVKLTLLVEIAKDHSLPLGNHNWGAQTLAQPSKDDPAADKSLALRPETMIVDPFSLTLTQRSAVQVEKCAQAGQTILESCGSNKISTASLKNNVKGRTEKPSGISFKSCERTVNLDEVEEIQFNELQDHCIEDKRIFLFKASIIPLRDNHGLIHEAGLLLLLQYERIREEHLCCYEIKGHAKSHRPKNDSDFNCCLQHPCYFCTSEDKNNCNTLSVQDFEQQEWTKAGNSPQTISRDKGSTTSSYSHVHPKLPDYDELAAKFVALKKEHQQRTAAVS